jgi:hypothetical protein
MILKPTFLPPKRLPYTKTLDWDAFKREQKGENYLEIQLALSRQDAVWVVLGKNRQYVKINVDRFGVRLFLATTSQPIFRNVERTILIKLNIIAQNRRHPALKFANRQPHGRIRAVHQRLDCMSTGEGNKDKKVAAYIL